MYREGLEFFYFDSEYIVSRDLERLSSNKNNFNFGRGEICVANFITPANGSSLGSYSVKNYIFSQKV